MSNNPIQTELCQMLEAYESELINKRDLIIRVRDLFYSNISKRPLTLDIIKMKFVMSSIIDSEDLTKLEFANEVKRQHDILLGRCQYRHCFATCLESCSSNPVVKDIVDIVYKIKSNLTLSKEEQDWIDKRSVDNESISTLSDLVIDKTIKLLKMLDCSHKESNDYVLLNTLFVQDEKECTNELIEKISGYLECLLGKRYVFIYVNYTSEGIKVVLY